MSKPFSIFSERKRLQLTVLWFSICQSLGNTSNRVICCARIVHMQRKNKLRLTHFLKVAKRSDIWILLSILLLAIGGILMIGSASMGLSIGDNFALMITVGKQAVFIILGYFMMCFASNHFRLHHLTSDKFIYLLLLMEAVLLACVGFEPAGGAYAWIRIRTPVAELTIQPSEFCKIVVVLMMAAYLGDSRRKKGGFWIMCRVPLIALGIYAGTIVFIQKDLGSAAVMILMCFAVFLIPKHRFLTAAQHGFTVLFLVCVGIVVFLISPAGMAFIEAMPLFTYQKNRFLSAVNPFMDQYGDGYQLINGLISFATGGLFGVGFGKSIQKYTNFPAANTDFILAVLVEETGFVGFMFLMSLYCLLMGRLFYYAYKIRSEKAKMILVGTAMYFLIHIFLNVGGVTGMIPLTGVPLPLMSAGGSSAMSMMLAVGISQAVISQFHKGEIV